MGTNNLFNNMEKSMQPRPTQTLSLKYVLQNKYTFLM